MAPLTSKSWLGLIFLVLGCLIDYCSAATYHRMQDKFDWVDRTCRGREDMFDEAWEEYRALATESNKAVKSERPKLTAELMLKAMFQVRPDPRSSSFTDLQGQSHNPLLASMNSTSQNKDRKISKNERTWFRRQIHRLLSVVRRLGF